MKKKGDSSHRDYEHSISKLQVIIDKAKDELREQMKRREIEERRIILGGSRGIHMRNENDEDIV
jgi:hypothetical protein